MICKKISLAIALGVSLIAAPASAQRPWSTNLIGSAEYDTENAMMLLAGLSTGPGGRGWAPRFGVQAYYLRYEVGTGDVNVTTVRPYVGLRNSFNGGSAGINAGYAFSNKEGDVGGRAIISDRGKGFVLSGGLDYWGTGDNFGYQLLGAYNFGTDGLWTRGRGTVPLRKGSSTTTRIGGEVAFLSGDGYSAWQPGVVMEFNNNTTGRVFGLGAGMKYFEGGEDAIYFSAEVSMPLFRR